MDTGSGKTKIATMRIAEELNRCRPGKLAWFLCPSVALAKQQLNYLRKHLPALQARLLIGEDGVDRWSTQRLWDAILHNMGIIVSTYAVLADALKHGFVTMARLSILISDECHHAMGNHPMNKIMQNFYHVDKRNGKEVPHVLGLSASPSNKTANLEKLESNLDCISRTPKASRDELSLFVYMPDMVPLIFDCSMLQPAGSTFDRFAAVVAELDISQDPYVKSLVVKRLGTASMEYQDVFLKQRTFCRDEFRSLVNKSKAVQEELGPWASEMYLAISYEMLLARDREGIVPFQLQHLREEEWHYIRAVMAQAQIPSVSSVSITATARYSTKLALLIKTLAREFHEDSICVLFVKTRATVMILSRLLSQHPQVKSRLRVGTFVGVSNNQKRKASISDIVGIMSQESTLDDLRKGIINIIVCTSVAEEGLDISPCNMVVCFDPPLNLKSFIQRRGRARAARSKYIMMFEKGKENLVQHFVELEKDMKEKYRDEMRQLQGMEASGGGGPPRELNVQSTGYVSTIVIPYVLIRR